MVKKFFRNLFKKEDQSSLKEVVKDESKTNTDQLAHSDEVPDHFLEEDITESPDSKDIQFHHIDDEEVDTAINEIDINDAIKESDINGTINETQIDSSLMDDLEDSKSEDLPDLPPEVIKALEEAESDSIPSLDELEDEDEGFNFTEIKPQSSSQEAPESIDPSLLQKQDPKIDDNMDSMDDFEFSELKVDLPVNEKQNIFQRIKSKVESIIRKRHYEKHHHGDNLDANNERFTNLYSPGFKSNIHQLFITSFVFITCYQSGKIVAFLLKPKHLETKNATAFNLSISTNKDRIKNIEQLNAFNALLTSKKPDLPKGHE